MVIIRRYGAVTLFSVRWKLALIDAVRERKLCQRILPRIILEKCKILQRIIFIANVDVDEEYGVISFVHKHISLIRTINIHHYSIVFT